MIIIRNNANISVQSISLNSMVCFHQHACKTFSDIDWNTRPSMTVTQAFFNNSQQVYKIKSLMEETLFEDNICYMYTLYGDSLPAFNS